MRFAKINAICEKRNESRFSKSEVRCEMRNVKSRSTYVSAKCAISHVTNAKALVQFSKVTETINDDIQRAVLDRVLAHYYMYM